MNPGTIIRRTRLADGRRVIVKSRPDAPPDFFIAEARGLTALRGIRALRVPEVLEAGMQRIVLEDLGEGVRATDYWRQAATGLARQHAIRGTSFGFDHRGFCGDSPQDNTLDIDGWRFFAERRLQPQARLARNRGLIDARDAAAIERVCARLRDRIPDMPPVLLHGDLWSGNLHVCADGSPALLDGGAVHYGWAEAELAMLGLFGTPPPEFFATYAMHARLREDWRERVSLYNLYHLLNHVNLFGAAYRGSLQASLAAFA
ncbi:MAG: fructosamine kinase family protein [Xanthomonadaceae bacterium]|nr:fructosamine kinase family protein [Xanthomonadaceae bacterium]